MKKPLFLLAPVLAAAFGVEELYRYTFCREGSKLLAPFLDKKGHEDAYYTRRDAASQLSRSFQCVCSWTISRRFSVFAQKDVASARSENT